MENDYKESVDFEWDIFDYDRQHPESIMAIIMDKAGDGWEFCGSVLLKNSSGEHYTKLCFRRKVLGVSK